MVRLWLVRLNINPPKFYLEGGSEITYLILCSAMGNILLLFSSTYFNLLVVFTVVMDLNKPNIKYYTWAIIIMTLACITVCNSAERKPLFLPKPNLASTAWRSDRGFHTLIIVMTPKSLLWPEVRDSCVTYAIIHVPSCHSRSESHATIPSYPPPKMWCDINTVILFIDMLLPKWMGQNVSSWYFII